MARVSAAEKWITGICLAVMVCFIGYLFMIASMGDLFLEDEKYSTEDLVENYRQNKAQIEEVKRYVMSIVPPNKSVEIEFDGRKKFFYFHVIDNGIYDSNWDVRLGSSKVDSLLTKLNWSKQTLTIIKEKLDAAHCISFGSGEPFQIGFQRSGMRLYSYNLFDNPVPDSMMHIYSDSCHYILYNPKVVLEHGGGVIGPDCFPAPQDKRDK
jgi:hypothetical protein